jgi:RimJ/RimL family protein N-acetyltransferase
LLEGKNVNLKVVEKDDLPLLLEWFSSPEFAGRYNPLDAQESKVEIERRYDKLDPEKKWFLIEKKDGSKIGFIGQGPARSCLEIGYGLISKERGKGYCTEAVQLMVDYLFLSKDIVRIQAETDPRNIASQKVLEKAGFQREGRIRKAIFVWGNWTDLYLYGILREEWKKPRILTKTA